MDARESCGFYAVQPFFSPGLTPSVSFSIMPALPLPTFKGTLCGATTAKTRYGDWLKELRKIHAILRTMMDQHVLPTTLGLVFTGMTALLLLYLVWHLVPVRHVREWPRLLRQVLQRRRQPRRPPSTTPEPMPSAPPTYHSVESVGEAESENPDLPPLAPTAPPPLLPLTLPPLPPLNHSTTRV